MIRIFALALLTAAAPPKAGAPKQPHAPSAGAGAAAAEAPLTTSPKLLERADPNLEQGARLMEKGDADGAIERFRRAEPKSADERAIVEYDVGSAQLLRAMRAAAEAAQQQKGKGAKSPGGGQPEPDSGPKIDKSALDDAKASFERAFGVATDPRLKSEAALAAGNTAATAQDLEDAIAQYRKAVVADPTNARAKTNLRRVLDAKRAQPPPPPQQDGDKKDDKNDDKKDQKDQKDQQKQDDKKGDQQKQDQQKQDQQKQDDKNDDKQKQDQKDQQKQDEKKTDPKDDQPKPGDAKKKQKKEDAKRLLDALRARERPMTPMEMRGQQRPQAAKQGKDW